MDIKVINNNKDKSKIEIITAECNTKITMVIEELTSKNMDIVEIDVLAGRNIVSVFQNGVYLEEEGG